MHIQLLLCLLHLQFALLIKVEDTFFEVVHLAEDQSFIEHRVVTPQQRHRFHLQDLLPLTTTTTKVLTTELCLDPAGK